MIELNKIYCEDCLDTMSRMPDNCIDSVVTDPPYGISFMNKKWDYEIPTVEIWKEVLRVLKPGGHILCACGTRTQHRMTVNIEDAGFEIRDVVAWIYGSGFPKSLDVSKAIDKQLGCEDQRVITHYKGQGPRSMFDGGKPRPASLPASQWEGWGTALKPAMELWTLARKPLSEKTVALNVLKWGTGGLNIDGCRVEFEDTQNPATNPNYRAKAGYKTDHGDKIFEGHFKTGGKDKITSGRFPANVIHDGSEEVLKGFPDAATQCGTEKKTTHNTGMFGIGTPGRIYKENNNSASRFFYCAKADRDERNDGLHQFADKFDSSRPWCSEESDRGRIATRLVSKQGKNNHPTVKPVKLIQYLQRLITPKGGLTYDPFGGSGTSGMSASNEGFNWIISEINPEYCDIGNKRIYNNNGLFLQKVT